MLKARCQRCRQDVETKVGPDGYRRYAYHNVGPFKRQLCGGSYDFAPTPIKKEEKS